MRIQQLTIDRGGFKEVTVEHRGKVLIWETKPYATVKLSGEPFQEINEYLSLLPITEQDSLFDALSEISEIFEFSPEDDTELSKIPRILARVYSIVTLDGIRNWMVRHPSFEIPDTIDDEFEEGAITPRGMTYLKEDYIELAAYGIALRLMVPIWGIYQTVLKANNRPFLELEMVSLLRSTNLLNCNASEKLLTYCTTFFESKMSQNDQIALVLKGLATTEFPRLIRAQTMIRRLSIFPILDKPPSHTPSHTLIANIFYFVKSRIAPDVRKVTDKVRWKIMEDGHGGDEDKDSYIEKNKIKKATSDGDNQLINYYTENVNAIARRRDPEVPFELIDESLDGIVRMQETPIQPFQVSLVEWVVTPVLTARTIRNLNQASQLRMIAVAQALLRHWGFFDIAVFLTVLDDDDDAGSLSALTRPPVVKARFTKEHQDRLKKAFPYERKTNTRRDRRGTTTPTTTNSGAIEIDMVSKAIFMGQWVYVGPQKLIEKTNHQKGRRVLTVPTDLKRQLTELVLFINEK